MRARLHLVTLSSCLAACDHGGVASTSAAPAETIAALVAGSAAAPQGAPERTIPEPSAAMPRPYRGRLGAAVALNATCVACHPGEAIEWRGSRHRQSNTNAAYRAAFAIEPSPFCRGCHAPESDPTKTPPAAVSDLGVGCVTCHVTEEGAVLAAHGAGARDAEAAPHAVQRSAEFAGAAACARCHEFAFPLPHGDDDGQLMQTTVREHERSPAASTACAACHMPATAGGRSHAFAGVRDPEWLRSMLRATAELGDEGEVRVTLVQAAPGHGFPTGDLFRRLEVGCEIRGAGGEAQARDVRHLARHFVIAPGRPGRTLVRDDRVLDEPVVVELTCPTDAPSASSGQLRWWVSYQRVATVGIGTDPATAKVESEVRLHAGVLPRATR